LAKLKLEAESEAAAAVPVPERVTVCGLFAALSLIERVAVRFPVADGVKVTLTVQVPLGVTVAPVQVAALLAKSPAFVPPIVTVEMVRLAVPELVTVSVWGALVVPTFCAPNVRLVEERLTEGAPAAAEIFVTNPFCQPWLVD
jgi:hypothetical protein